MKKKTDQEIAIIKLARESARKEEKKRRMELVQRQVSRALEVINYNTSDNKWLYIMSYEPGLYKVGVSRNPLGRLKTLDAQVPAERGKLKIMYLGTVREGLTEDVEKAIHKDISKCNEYVRYQGNFKLGSREWFRCSLESLVFYIDAMYADMKEYPK